MTVIFSIVIQSVSEESPGKAPIYGEVCVASEVLLRKVKFVYDKWSFTKGEVAVIKKYRHFDQVKRVEKSPKAKQYLPTLILSS